MHVAHQALVNSHFNNVARYWADVYECERDVYARILQERLSVVLGFVDATGLPPGSRVLEVGCGAGYGTLALAGRGYKVYALDAVKRMIDATRALLWRANASQTVRCSLADVRALPFSNHGFDLVVALGVLPWLESPVGAVRELSRVLRPGGFLVASVDNRWSLRRFLDPISNPLLRPIKEVLKRMLRRLGRLEPKARPHRMSIRGFDALLESMGFALIDAVTLGFGPLTFLGRELLLQSLSLKVHSTLQAEAYKQVPVIRACGAEYVIRAKASM